MEVINKLIANVNMIIATRGKVAHTHEHAHVNDALARRLGAQSETCVNL